MKRVELLVFVLLSMPLFAAQEEPVPNENATRAKIDKLIKEFQDSKRKATVGLLQETIGLSISYGAPTWNQGDHESCFRFYAKTAKSLCNAFADPTTATDPARASLEDLKAALERATRSADVDRNAWAMRYAFDKNQLACTTIADHIQGLVDIGTQNFRRGQFEEAQDAFQTGTRLLAELDGQTPDTIPIGCRFAPLALANACFAQKKYKEAVAPINAALRYMPDWPAAKFDLRSLHESPDEYEDMLKDLEDKAKAEDKDADLQFLLGYEYHFTGKKNAAQEQFKKALTIDANNALAKAFVKRAEPPPAEMEPKDSKAR